MMTGKEYAGKTDQEERGLTTFTDEVKDILRMTPKL